MRKLVGCKLDYSIKSHSSNILKLNNHEQYSYFQLPLKSLIITESFPKKYLYMSFFTFLQSYLNCSPVSFIPQINSIFCFLQM